MNIVLFGAGYVGTVTGACLAHCGHRIVFIDSNPLKVKAINAAKSPIFEPHLDQLITQGAQNGLLIAKQHATNDLANADLVMIAVPTPALFNGILQLDYVKNVLQSIMQAAENRKDQLVVAIRSTIHPLALRRLLQELQLEKSQISIVVNPEFLRESTAVNDFFHPPFCIAGGDDKSTVEYVLSVYEGICPNQFAIDLESACLIKYACNAFHALKIAFANEIGSICESLGTDPIQLMNIFCQDQILNCSSAYLRPGFAFGGSCLPKDLRSLLSLGRELEEPLPLLTSILPSNQLRLQKMLAQILQAEHKNLAILGMSFKKNNDDLRESPFVELIEHLVGKGIKIRIFDPDVQPQRLMGSNLEAFNIRFKHLLSYLKNCLNETLDRCDGIVLCKDICNHELVAYQQRHSVPLYDLQYSLPQQQKYTECDPKIGLEQCQSLTVQRS